MELARVAYIFDNSQTAELMLQAIDGRLNILKQPLPDWIETGLILPSSQRSLARQAIQTFADEQNLELELASLLKTSYVGKVVTIDRHYGLQLVEGKAIVHDLSIVKLPQPSSSVIEVSYDNGVAAVRA